MNFQIKPTIFFHRQLKQLDNKSKKLIHSKIQLIKSNPYRYKAINSDYLKNLFRVKLNINNKESRLIYTIIKPDIIIICLLERKNDYKKLDKLLKNIFKI